MKKQLLILLAALSITSATTATALVKPVAETAEQNPVAVHYNFTDTMEGTAFKAPASNYGWKVTKGALSPDNALTENNQIGYLAQAIALNENKYISMDFYATSCPFDIMLLPYAETVNPWSKDGVGVHCMAGGWLRLDTYIDANEGWLADYTGIGSGADGYAHKLEIISDGTNLTFKVDGADAFAGTTVAIPADSVQLVLRAAKGSYIDNLYIADSQPTEVTATELDFTDKLDLSDFTAMALDGWTGGNGKYHPVQEGGLYNASATKYNKLLDLTGKQYISFDFYSTAATFDVGLLDGNSENLWGNGLFIHMPFSDGTIGINNYVDCTQGTYYDGLSINVVDGQAHTLEIFVENGKVSYALDGNPMIGNGGTTQFNAPADTAYLVFRAVGTESYIDNLYVGESAPAVKGFDFESSCDGNAFTAWESSGWNVVDGGFTAKSNWGCTQMLTPLDLTKNQDITFDVYLSSADADKQFNVGFFPDANPENAHTPNAGVTYSLGSTLFLGSSFDRNNWIADVSATLYNDTWHSVKISVENAKLSIAVDGVEYDTLTADIPGGTAYLLLQSTNTANVLDNLAFEAKKTPYDDVFEKYGSGKGWGYADEKLFPNEAWSVINTVETLDVSKNQEIEFDVYLSSDDTDKQFNVGFFASKVEEDNVDADTGLTFSFGETIWVSTNFGRGAWASECVKNYFDGQVHHVSLKLINKAITLTVDGELLYFLTNENAYTPTLTEDNVYLLLQSAGTETYIQNYTVEEITVYTVTFKNADGTVLQTLTVEEGEMPMYTGVIPEKATDEQYIYTFKGWDKEVVTATEDAVYTAQYDATEITYTVTFKNWDGTVLQTGTVVKGATPEYAGATPEKAADDEYTYTFKGWDQEISAVTGDVEYTAQFEATKIPVEDSSSESTAPEDSSSESATPEDSDTDTAISGESSSVKDSSVTSEEPSSGCGSVAGLALAPVSMIALAVIMKKRKGERE